MLRRKVTSPDGRVWKLGRRWMPRRRRFARIDIGDVGIPDVSGGLDDLGIVGVIIGAILLAIAAVVIALLLFNVIAFTIELLIVVVLFVAGAIGRVVFRRPWTVYAVTKGQPPFEARVVGWRASGQMLRDAASTLASGGRLQSPAGDRR